MFCKNCGRITEKGTRFCKNCGVELPRNERFHHHIITWFGTYKKYIISIGVVVVILVIIGIYDDTNTKIDSSYTPSTSTYFNTSNQQTDIISNQNKIASSVVNILCADGSDEGLSGGSGTIMNSDGLILTNAHIIPQNEQEEPLAELCLVTLPDAKGKAKEIYYGEPIIIPTLSNGYDLAFVKIRGVYIDDEDRKSVV